MRREPFAPDTDSSFVRCRLKLSLERLSLSTSSLSESLSHLLSVRPEVPSAEVFDLEVRDSRPFDRELALCGDRDLDFLALL